VSSLPESPKDSAAAKDQADQPTPIDRLFESPDVQKGIAEFIKQLPPLIQSWINSGIQKETTRADAQRHSAKWANGIVMLAIVVITLAILSGICLLAWGAKISGEATAFLFGTIVGTVFGILGRFFVFRP